MITIRTKDGARTQDLGGRRRTVHLRGWPPSADALGRVPAARAGVNRPNTRVRDSDIASRRQRGRSDLAPEADRPALGKLLDRSRPSRPRLDSSDMSEDLRTTAVVQRFLNDLNGDSPAAPIVRELLSHSAERLHVLCSSMLVREYPRLTRPPLNLRSEEMLSGVVERLLKAMEKTRPPTVRRFFALANQHMRWELNDFARRLDERSQAVELADDLVPAPESSGSRLSANARRMFEAIASLPAEEREAFEFSRIQGLSSTEVAEIVGVTDRTVQRRINRASLLLMRALADLAPPQQAGGRVEEAGEE
jgi:RNA polymerase sigma-70 factor (ECF subfamily)